MSNTGSGSTVGVGVGARPCWACTFSLREPASKPMSNSAEAASAKVRDNRRFMNAGCLGDDTRNREC